MNNLKEKLIGGCPHEGRQKPPDHKMEIIIRERVIDGETITNISKICMEGVIKPSLPIERDAENKKQEAVDFVEKEIMTKAPKEGEVVAEGLWDSIARILINKMKEQALVFAGEALEHLKDKGIEWAVNVSAFALEKAQDFLFEKYQTTLNSRDRENFKKKIIEKFPDSGLAAKLRNE